MHHQQDHHKCPQCQDKAKKSDIRNLFAPNISAIDTAERDHLRNRLEIERQERAKVRNKFTQYLYFFSHHVSAFRVEIDRARLQKRIYELERIVSSLKNKMKHLSNERKPPFQPLVADAGHPRPQVSTTKGNPKPLSESRGKNQSSTRGFCDKKTPQSCCDNAATPVAAAAAAACRESTSCTYAPTFITGPQSRDLYHRCASVVTARVPPCIHPPLPALTLIVSVCAGLTIGNSSADAAPRRHANPNPNPSPSP